METRVGNIRATRVVPSKYWRFTWNNYTKAGVKELIKKFKNKGCLYIFGYEVAPTTGTPHLQGYIESPKKIRPIETFGTKEITWLKATKGRQSNIDYCSKDGNIVTNFNIPKDPLKDKKLYKWQKKVIKIIKREPDDRTIHWFWGEGNNGKTALAKHICMNYDACYVNGAGKDIKYFIANLNNVPKIVIFGIPRATDSISYSALEEVKDGIIFSPKYESCMKMYNPPHIIVLANFEPDREMLSPDRWVVKRLHK